jgi:hypothetical protein
MSIPHVSEGEFRAVIRETFTPSEEMQDPRTPVRPSKNLTAIDRALNSRAGKSSSSAIAGSEDKSREDAAQLHNGSDGAPIYVSMRPGHDLRERHPGNRQ